MKIRAERSAEDGRWVSARVHDDLGSMSGEERGGSGRAGNFKLPGTKAQQSCRHSLGGLRLGGGGGGGCAIGGGLCPDSLDSLRPASASVAHWLGGQGRARAGKVR